VIEGMSQETFDENRAAILAEVKELMSNPQSRRRSRLFELYEKSGHERLAEVFRTRYGAVIVHRSYGSVDRLRTAVVGAPFSRGNREEVVIPFTDDPDQRLPIMARNFRYRLPVRNFRQWIAEGKTRHAISYRGA
jgi:hypothetical protein